MRPVVIDFETYYDQDYTLNKLSTEAYCRDKRFETHGAAIKWSPEHNAIWYGNHRLAHILAEEDWSDVFLIAHHSQFDGFILSHHYNVHPKMWGCTLSMARLAIGTHLSVSLDAVRSFYGIPAKSTPYNLFKGKHWGELNAQEQAQVAEGCCDEAESIWRIFCELAESFPAEEYTVVDATVRMFTEPHLRADIETLAALWESEHAQKRDRAKALGVADSQLQSADKFQALLEAEGVEIEHKEGKNGAIPAFARTDDFMRGLLEHENDRIRGLAEARLGVKSTLLQTRAETLGWMATRGPLPVYLRYWGAHTGRWSGGDGVNFQNFKRDSDLRRAILAPPSHYLGIIDLSQIECVAEGQLVLTEKGTKAIQDIKLTDKVWDGQNFVTHQGVLYKGIQEVISYQGLTATPSHIVYLGSDSSAQSVPLSVAAALGLDIHSIDAPSSVCQTPMRKSLLSWVQNLWKAGHSISFQICKRISFMGIRKFTTSYLRRCGNRSHRQQWSLRAWKFAIINAARKCQQSLYYLLGAGCWRSVGYAGFQAGTPRMWLWARSDQGSSRTRFNRRADYRALQAGPLENLRTIQARPERKIQAGNQAPKKAKVYDILNAGPRYRFTVSGVLVSNCRLLNYLAGQDDVTETFRAGQDPYIGIASQFYRRRITVDDKNERGTGKQLELSCGFGCGAVKFQATAKLGIYGPPVDISEEQAERAVALYRETHPAVVAYWRTASRIIARLAGGPPMDWGPMHIKEGKIYLPNGAWLDYTTLENHADPETGDRYWRIKKRHGWTKLYGGKLVENVVQALARVVLSQAMLRIRGIGYRILNTTHDELLILIPADGREYDHLQTCADEMVREPDWLPGIPLAAEASLSERYSK